MNTELIMRVREMERCFDLVRSVFEEAPEALSGNKEIISVIRTLAYYMDSGLWLSDYQADERGELPHDLKRGVLSEDGLYNLLCDAERLLLQ